MSRARARPAETAAAGGGVAGLIAAAAAHNWLAAAIAAVGFVPSVVTLLVANGGLRGAWRRLMDGSPPR